MLSLRIISRLNSARRCYGVISTNNIIRREYSKIKEEELEDHKIGDIAAKYKPFKDEDAEVILDIYEEKLKYINTEDPGGAEGSKDVFNGLNLTRGLNGVFEIEDLVEVLERENVEDIFVASVPKEINYVEYICVVTAKSVRHMKAIMQFVRRVYKQKRHKSDIVPKVEGENSKDWMAIDLGNIALHIFSRQSRAIYDLDSLWSVGPKYDDECNKEDPIVAMLEKHSIYLKDLKPAT